MESIEAIIGSLLLGQILIEGGRNVIKSYTLKYFSQNLISKIWTQSE